MNHYNVGDNASISVDEDDYGSAHSDAMTEKIDEYEVVDDQLSTSAHANLAKSRKHGSNVGLKSSENDEC
jgi:hypothetical protein